LATTAKELLTVLLASNPGSDVPPIGVGLPAMYRSDTDFSYHHNFALIVSKAR